MRDVLLKRNLDPINGGCWFCHKAIENNEEYGFSMEWDAYFHTNCLEQALLSDDIRTRREAQVVAREFRIEFEEHEEDFLHDYLYTCCNVRCKRNIWTMAVSLERALEQLKILGWDIITNEYVLCPYCKDNIDRDVAFWENILEQAEDQVELIKMQYKGDQILLDADLPSAEEAVRLTEEELSYAKERCKTNDTMEHDG